MIRTTPVGRPPRGPEPHPLPRARDKGKPYDAGAFDATIQAATWKKLAALRERADIAERRIG